LAGPGWTWQVKTATALAVACALAWRGITETEAEDIDNLCNDYKHDILDSMELVPAEEGEG
jgi:hypothetical protein